QAVEGAVGPHHGLADRQDLVVIERQVGRGRRGDGDEAKHRSDERGTAGQASSYPCLRHYSPLVEQIGLMMTACATCLFHRAGSIISQQGGGLCHVTASCRRPRSFK